MKRREGERVGEGEGGREREGHVSNLMSRARLDVVRLPWRSIAGLGRRLVGILLGPGLLLHRGLVGRARRLVASTDLLIFLDLQSPQAAGISKLGYGMAHQRN